MSETVPTLRQLLSSPRATRVAGVHDALSALVAQRCGFDALWASGLGIAAVHGMPDANVLTMSEVRDATVGIARATSLPVISDCDTGFGELRNLRRTVTEFEHGGIDAICIEDKLYPKRNSFRDSNDLIDAYEFAMKVRAAKRSQSGSDFMVIARLESLISGVGVEDALHRARLYADTGADALVVHSKAPVPDEVYEFARLWRDEGRNLPLIAIPTTYHRATISELEDAGFAMVIYANQALRAAVHAMEDALTRILASGSSTPIEDRIAPIGTLFELTGEEKIDDYDDWFATAIADARRSGSVDASHA